MPSEPERSSTRAAGRDTREPLPRTRPRPRRQRAPRHSTESVSQLPQEPESCCQHPRILLWGVPTHGLLAGTTVRVTTRRRPSYFQVHRGIRCRLDSPTRVSQIGRRAHPPRDPPDHDRTRLSHLRPMRIQPHRSGISSLSRMRPTLRARFQHKPQKLIDPASQMPPRQSQ